MILTTYYQKARRARRPRTRIRWLGFERCEDRNLLSTVPTAPLVPEVQVHFRMELTDSTGAPISAVEAGNEFAVNVYVVDERPLPQGVFAAYLDLVFDNSLVERSGAVRFGESYTNALVSGGATPGVLDEVGAVATLFDRDRDSVAASGALLFRAPFRAIEAGPVTFLTEPADRFPDSYVLLFGVDQPVQTAEIGFDATTLDIQRPFAAPLLVSFNSANRDFVSSSGSGATYSKLSATNADPISQLTTRLRQRSVAAPAQLPDVSTRDSHLDSADEQRRFSELSPLQPQLPPFPLRHSPLLTVERSDWIELPFQLFSPGQHLSLPEFSHRESWLPHSTDRQEEFSTDDSETDESAWQSEVLGQGRKRAFLRMNWSDRGPIDRDSNGSLAAHMIDIDEIFAEAMLIELPDLHELFVDKSEGDSTEVPRDPNGEPQRINSPLRAARSTSLAVDVAVGNNDRPAAEPSHVPDPVAEAKQADAAPPKPTTNIEEATKGPA